MLHRILLIEEELLFGCLLNVSKFREETIKQCPAKIKKNAIVELNNILGTRSSE
jgi:hypothetical protein